MPPVGMYALHVAIAEALGIDPTTCVSLAISLHNDDPPTVTATSVLTRDQSRRLRRIFKATSFEEVQGG